MPSICDVLNKENHKPPHTVLLFHEGLFLKAYERSAWQLSLRYGFKVSCRFFKVANDYVASVGFPISSLQRYLPGSALDDCMAERGLKVPWHL